MSNIKVVDIPATEALPERTRQFLQWAREIGTKHKPNMAAFVILAWDENGNASICGNTHAKENPIPNYLLPAWIAEHFRAEHVTGVEIRTVLRDIGALPSKSPEGA